MKRAPDDHVDRALVEAGVRQSAHDLLNKCKGFLLLTYEADEVTRDYIFWGKPTPLFIALELWRHSTCDSLLGQLKPKEDPTDDEQTTD